MKTILLYSDGDSYRALGGADSGVLRPGEPVFVPEPVETWRSQIAPAIRISRLGMNIKPTFARQYYCEATLVHLLLPAGNYPVPPLFVDRAIAPGRWIDLSKTADISAVVDDMADKEILSLGKALTFEDLQSDRAVCFTSRYMTLKTGDIIVLGDYALDLGSPQLDTRLTARMGSEPVLDIKFK